MKWTSFIELVKSDIIYKTVLKDFDLEQDPYPRFFHIINELENVYNSKSGGAKLLDLGCHNTQFMSLVKTKFNFDVTGADDWESKEPLQFEGKYFSLNIDSKWVKLNNEKYSVITSFEVIEHMIDTDLFLKQCNDHLELGGKLLLSTPNINSLRNRVLVPFGVYPSGIEYKNSLHHVRLYNPNVLRNHLNEFGFKVIKIRGVSFLPHKFSRGIFRYVDNILSNMLPSFCNNFIVVAEKIK